MRLIGPARAKLMLFTGRRLDGEQAVAWGLAEVLADDPVQARAVHHLAMLSRVVAVHAWLWPWKAMSTELSPLTLVQHASCVCCSSFISIWCRQNGRCGKLISTN